MAAPSRCNKYGGGRQKRALRACRACYAVFSMGISSVLESGIRGGIRVGSSGIQGPKAGSTVFRGVYFPCKTRDPVQPTQVFIIIKTANVSSGGHVSKILQAPWNRFRDTESEVNYKRQRVRTPGSLIWAIPRAVVPRFPAPLAAKFIKGSIRFAFPLPSYGRKMAK